MRKNIGMLLAVLLLCFVCTGCSGGKEANEELNIAVVSSPITIDPQMCFDSVSSGVLAFVCETLYRYNEEHEIVPGLAEGYDLSDDGLVYTFHLKENLKWSNGEPLTAGDFVCAFRRLADPRVGSEAVFLIVDSCKVKNAAAVNTGEIPVDMLGVSSPDNNTLVVELEEPCPYFTSLLSKTSFAPCDTDFYHTTGENYAKSVETCLSSGPYIIDRYEPLATQIHLTKNPYFIFSDEISIEGVTIQVIHDHQQSIMCFESGLVDVTSVSGEMLELTGGDEMLHIYPLAALMYITVNQRSNPVLQNRNIRMAISKSIDRDTIVKNILGDGYSPTTRLIPPDYYREEDGSDFGGDPDRYKSYAGYDPEEAKRLWEQGLKESGVDTVELELLYAPGENNLMDAICTQLENTLTGLDIERKVVTMKERIQRERRGEYDLLSFGWVADYADPTTFLQQFLTYGSSYGYSNPEYDALYNTAQTAEYALDKKRRDEMLHKTEDLLMEDVGFIPLYTLGEACLVNPAVKGYQLTPENICIVTGLSKEDKK